MIHDKYYELSLVCYTYKPYVKLWLLADVSLMALKLSEILATPSVLCFLIRKIQTIQEMQFSFVSLWAAS
jgi:hypothetical protein